ncbi:hypothetical protein [Oryza sativa Japonica Group]|uniref:Uncharacterized protein n=2 Tax=Oryza sativa subsp. japonica TaxID=39947 RepID=Q5N7P1_ORYSJ|nr:hypothetical protein [Oryza sativa Japonica Group]BAD82537.1 hypothetical protein [Oryza sativa Japonica Group]
MSPVPLSSAKADPRQGHTSHPSDECASVTAAKKQSRWCQPRSWISSAEADPYMHKRHLCRKE